MANKTSNTKFNWTSHFGKNKVRAAITNMVKATCDCGDGCLLDSNMSPEVFANTLLAYVPKAYKFLPSGLVDDEKKQKAIVLLAELAKSPEDRGWRNKDSGPDIACAIIMLMSHGVKGIDFGYSGGWDETSYNSDLIIHWHEGISLDGDKSPIDIANELMEAVKAETGIEDNDILYTFLDDSGAGDGNTYYRYLLLNLDTWGISLSDYTEDEYEQDEVEG